MPVSPTTRQAKNRVAYAKRYPPGFKRRRNAEQRKKQIIAQRRYRNQPHVLRATRYVRQVKQLLEGRSAPLVARYVGCSGKALHAYLQSTTTATAWRLAFHVSAQSFDLTDEAERKRCFHYTNMYARPLTDTGASQSPLPQAPWQANSLHAELSAQV